MSSTDPSDKLSRLTEAIESFETQIQKGMSQEQVENAIEEVSNTIAALEKLKQEMATDSALNSAQVVESTDDSPFQ